MKKEYKALRDKIRVAVPNPVMRRSVLLKVGKALRAEKAEICTRCAGGCPDKDHPAIHHLCAECHQENVKAFNRVSEENERLREAVEKWLPGIADGILRVRRAGKEGR